VECGDRLASTELIDAAPYGSCADQACGGVLSRLAFGGDGTHLVAAIDTNGIYF
jgi:hypothetical protein